MCIRTCEYYANCLECEQKDYSFKMLVTKLEWSRTIGIIDIRCHSGYDPCVVI